MDEEQDEKSIVMRDKRKKNKNVQHVLATNIMTLYLPSPIKLDIIFLEMNQTGVVCFQYWKALIRIKFLYDTWPRLT